MNRKINKIKWLLIFDFKIVESFSGEVESGSIFGKTLTPEQVKEILKSDHFFDFKAKKWVSPLTKWFSQDLEKILK